MAKTVTLKALRDRIYELGELREVYVPNNVLNEEINQSLRQLYDTIVDSDAGYYESTQTISVVANTDTYALPTDFYKSLGFDVERADGTFINMRRYNHAERNKYTSYGGGGVNREWTEYRIRGNNVVFVPTPDWTGNVRHFYVPVMTALENDGDIFDGIHGWDDFVVYDCLVKFIGGKEESDPAVWSDLRDRTHARILRMVKPRDLGEPNFIRDLEEEEAERLWPRYGTPP